MAENTGSPSNGGALAPSGRRASAGGARPKRRVGAILLLVVGVICVLAGGFYSHEVKSFLTLTPWSRGEPKEAIGGLMAGLEARDPAQVRACIDEETILVVEEAGRVTALRAGGASMKNPSNPVPVERLLPASPDSATFRYDLSAPTPGLEVRVPCANGCSLDLTLNRRTGGWRVAKFGLTDPNAENALSHARPPRGAR